jgi:hypothetical protein
MRIPRLDHVGIVVDDLEAAWLPDQGWIEGRREPRTPDRP